jgi:hypothetical protein
LVRRTAVPPALGTIQRCPAYTKTILVWSTSGKRRMPGLFGKAAPAVNPEAMRIRRENTSFFTSNYSFTPLLEVEKEWFAFKVVVA